MLASAMSWARLLAVVLSTELAVAAASQCEGFPKLSGTWFEGTQFRASIEREDKTPQTSNFTGNRTVTFTWFPSLWYVFTQRSTDKILPNGRMEFQEDGRVVYFYQILEPTLWDKNPDTIDVFGLNRGYACVFTSETTRSELECVDVFLFLDTLRIKLRFADGCAPVGMQAWAGMSTDNFDVELDLEKRARADYLELEMVEEPGPEFAYDENAVSAFLQGESWTSSATLEEHIARADWGRPNWRRNYGNYRGYGRYGNYGNVGTSTSPAASTTASPESSTVPSSTTLTSASADCECPMLPSSVRFQGGLEDVFAGSKNISGVHEIRQFHENGTEAANGRILSIVTTGDLEDALSLPTQPQHMVCLCLPNYRIQCVNQMTNSWALGTFQGVEESTCTAQSFQLVGLFRDKFRTMFGPAVVDTEAPGLDLLQSLEPPSARLPLLSSFVCEWTGVSRAQPRLGSSSSFFGSGSYDILFREYYVVAKRRDQFRVPAEDGRYVVLQPLSDQKVLCAFADNHTFSCIHAVNCLSVHGTVEAAANFTVQGLQFLGNSGGFCLGQPVPIDYNRFLSDGESLQWMGRCTAEQEVTQFEFWVCTCAVDNPDTLLRPCDLDSIPIARSQALFVEECEAMSSDPGSCAQEFADLGQFQERPGNSYYGRFFVPTQANCELYRSVRDRWQNGSSDNSATPASSAGVSLCPSVPDVARDLIISLLVSEPGGDPSGVELYALRAFQDETVRIVKNFGASFELSFDTVTQGSFFTVGFGNGTAFEEFFGFQPDFLAPFSFAIGRDILEVQGAGFGAEIWRPVDVNNTALFQADQGFAARKAEAPQPYAPGFQQWSLARSVGSTVAAPWGSFCGTPAPEIPCPAAPDGTVPGLIFSLVVSDTTGSVALELFAMRELRDHLPVLIKSDADGNLSNAFLGEPRTIPQGTSITVAFNTSDSLQLIPGQKPDYQVDFDFNPANGDGLLLYDAVSLELSLEPADAWIWTFPGIQGFASRQPGLSPLPALEVFVERVDGIGQYFVSSNLASVPWGTYCVTPAVPACPPAPSGELLQTSFSVYKIVPGLIFSLMVLGPGSAAVELTALRDLPDPDQSFVLGVIGVECSPNCAHRLPSSVNNMRAGDRMWIVFTQNENYLSLIDLGSPKAPDRIYGLNVKFEGKKGQGLFFFSEDDVEDAIWDRWGIPRTIRGEGEEWVFQGHATRKPGLVSDYYEGLTQWSITRDVYDFPRVPWDTYCVG